MSGVEYLPREQPAPAQAAASGAHPDVSVPPHDERRHRMRGRLGVRSLTARLVIGVVALVVVLVAAISAGTYYLLRAYLLDRLDQQVTSAAGQNAEYFQRCLQDAQPVPGTNRLSCFSNGTPGLTQEEWIAFVNPDGTTTLSLQKTTGGRSYTPLQLTPDQARAVAAAPGASWRIHYGYEELVIQAQQTDQGLYVVTGLSTDEVVNTMRTLVYREVVIGLAAVVLALFATSYGVSFGLRKLRRVTTTANEVAAELSPIGAGLDRRVDVPDDGTEVGQLAESMNTLLSAVETQFAARLASEARLRQFLADASHELRTPLTSIRGYAELARMQKAAGTSADDNLARIESEGTRMSRLVEDLLMLARSDQPAESEPRRELVDVAQLLHDVESTSHAAFPERRIDTRVTPGLHVLGDPDQLLRAVRNLVANAAVHTAPGRDILVRGAPDGDAVVIQVIDGGPGLPPEEAAHVFERFWRADKARTRARGGSGLGLAIVASIVAAHGGTVRFDSSVEHGSTVTVRLPAVSGLSSDTVVPSP